MANDISADTPEGPAVLAQMNRHIPNWKENAALIAAAPSALRFLLGEVKWLTRELEEIKFWSHRDVVRHGECQVKLARSEAERARSIEALEFYSQLDYHPSDWEFNGNELVDFGTRAREALTAQSTNTVTEELTKLRAERDKLKQDMHLAVSNAGKDLIAERDALQAELSESARLHGIGGSREAKLMAQVEEATKLAEYYAQGAPVIGYDRGEKAQEFLDKLRGQK